MATTTGIDVSVWQDENSTPQQVDFNKAKANGAEFVFIKAGQLNFVDQDYLYNWQTARAAGLMRGAYWYIDWRGDVDKQAIQFADLLSKDPGELPPVADFEMATGCPADSALKLRKFLLRLENEIKRFPMVYTSPRFWAAHGSKDASWLDYDLWIANYYQPKPGIPAPWKSWKFWQYTDRGDGLAFGCESKTVDMNYWNGTLEELRNYAGLPAVPALTMGQKVDRLWAAHPDLHGGD